MKTKVNYRIKLLSLAAPLLTLFSLNPVLGQTPTTTTLVRPNPVLVYVGPEYYTAGGKNLIRYRYTVDNLDQYPAELFAASPDLPPCGTNTNASRTWVDFFDQSGRRLNGFCALTAPSKLNGIWFAAEENTIPPSWVYIELNDRRTNTKYKSGLAETTQ